MKCQKSCESLEHSIINSPLKSAKKRLAELGILQTTMMSYMKKDVEIIVWQSSFVNELIVADTEKRKLACDE